MARCKQSLEQLNAYFDSSTHICIQYFDGLIPEETLWKDPKIEKLENVIFKSLTTDPKGNLRRRVIMNFKDENSAKTAAEELHQKEICGNIVEAFVTSELIGRLKKKKKACSLAEIFVCGLNQETSSEDLVKIFERFKSIESFDIIEDCNGESTGCAVIKFRNLWEAYEAEFALHGQRVGKKILSLSMRRKESQTVKIPWTILEIVIKRQIRERAHVADGNSSRGPQMLFRNIELSSKLPKTDGKSLESCTTEESEVKGETPKGSGLTMFYSDLLVSEVEAVKEENSKGENDNKDSSESSEFECVDWEDPHSLSKSQHLNSEPVGSQGGVSDWDSVSTSKVSCLKVKSDGNNERTGDKENCEPESDSDLEVLDKNNPDLTEYNLLDSLDLQDDVSDTEIALLA